jgi:hypothetical protein
VEAELAQCRARRAELELRAEVAEQQAHGQQLQDYGQPRTTRFNSNNSRESVKRHEANIITPELNKLESSLIRQLDSINRRNGNVQASIRGLDWHYQNHLAGDQHNRAARRRRALFPRPAEGDDVAWRVFLAATNQTTTEERLVVQRLEDQQDSDGSHMLTLTAQSRVELFSKMTDDLWKVALATTLMQL